MTSTQAWLAMRREFRFPPGYEWDTVKIDKVFCNATKKHYFAREMNHWNRIGCPVHLHPQAVHMDASERPVPKWLSDAPVAVPTNCHQQQYNVVGGSGGAAFAPAPMRPPYLHQPHLGFHAGPAQTPANRANQGHFTNQQHSSTSAGSTPMPGPVAMRQFGVNASPFTHPQQMGSADSGSGRFIPLPAQPQRFVPAPMDQSWRSLFTSDKIAEQEWAKVEAACQNLDIDWTNLPPLTSFPVENFPPEWLGGSHASVSWAQRRHPGFPVPSSGATRAATRVAPQAPVPTHITAPGPVVTTRVAYPTPESPFPKLRTPSLDEGLEPLFPAAIAPGSEHMGILTSPISDLSSHSELYRMPTPA